MQDVRRIDRLFADYAAVHVTVGNRWCHATGFPIMMVGMTGLLARIPLSSPLSWPLSWPIDGGMIFLAGLAVGYAVLEWRLALLFALASPIVWLGGVVLPGAALIGAVALGNVVALAGHLFFEKNGPAAIREGLVGLAVGPLWLLNLAVRVV